MKFYIASRFANKEEVKKLNALVIEKGHELSGDWTDHKQVKPYSKEPDRSRSYAKEDMRSAMEADVFVLLTSEQPGAGSSSELGAAIAMNLKFGKPKIYVIGDFPECNMFNYHPSILMRNSIEDILDEIKLS